MSGGLYSELWFFCGLDICSKPQMFFIQFWLKLKLIPEVANVKLIFDNKTLMVIFKKLFIQMLFIMQCNGFIHYFHLQRKTIVNIYMEVMKKIKWNPYLFSILFLKNIFFLKWEKTFSLILTNLNSSRDHRPVTLRFCMFLLGKNNF